MKIKIVLIALFPSNKFPLIGESHGICVISGYLRKKFGSDISIELFDQQINSDDEIITGIINFRPHIIGFSVKIGTLPELETLFSRLNLCYDEYCTNLPVIVLGNSVAHFNYEYLLKKYPHTIISLGEGEVSFEDLVLFIRKRIPDKNNIRNIAYVESDSIIKSPVEYLPSSQIAQADRQNSMKFYKNGGEVYIEGSRGCDYCGCSICECRLFLGSKNTYSRWRPKNVEEILSEIAFLESIGINKVTFSDEDFWGPHGIGTAHAYAIADGILCRGLKIEYRVNLRVKTIYSNDYSEERIQHIKDTLSVLKESGLTKVFLGFESGSQSQLQRYNKGFSIEEFVKAKKILENLGIEYELGYISFDPLMRLEELIESLNFIRDNNCIPYISNIFKELRIQKGNDSYINKIRRYESEHSCRIIGKLDINEQVYPILNYLDERVKIIVPLFREYEIGMYKMYYFMRIITQYSKENATDLEKIIHDVMNRIKTLDFDLMMSCCKMLQQNFCNKGLIKLYNEVKSSRDNLLNDLYDSLQYNSTPKAELIKFLHTDYKYKIDH